MTQEDINVPLNIFCCFIIHFIKKKMYDGFMYVLL